MTTHALHPPTGPRYVVPVLVLLAAMVVVLDGTGLNPLETALVAGTGVTAVWWVVARRRLTSALRLCSLGVAGLALVVLVAEGPTSQLVPWQVLAGVVALSALWRTRGPCTGRVGRVLHRAVLAVLLLACAAATQLAPVASLPAPTGPFEVGSTVLTWADRSRREPLTAAAGDLRQVVAQAWYPTDRTSGRTTRYVGAGGDTALMTDLPPGLFRRYDHTRVPAHDDVPVSPAQDRWPVLLFSPGLGMARQSYTALCTELASRGYVVVAISHPYESPVTVLADGHRAAPHRFDPSTPAGRAEVARLVDVRAADSSFVLSRLERLTTSPLAGHLDLAHVGILGHSLGGATAARAMALDHRFRAGADLDGRLFGAVPSLDRPFLWVQSEASTETRRELGPTHRTRDELLERLRGGGALVTLAGTTHLSFSDVSGYLTPVGRQLLGRLPAAGIGTAEAARTAATTADLVTGVLGPVLHAPPAHTLAQVAARDTTVRVERTVEAARQGKVSVTTVRRTR